MIFSRIFSKKRQDTTGFVDRDMIEILMNGVFSFTMTLIVKNIPLPTVADIANPDIIVNFFERTMYDGISFIFTFLILALFWLFVFEVHRGIKFVEPGVLLIEFVLLLTIVLIPISSIYLNYSDDVPVFSTAFHLNVLVSGLLVLILALYTLHRKVLHDPDISYLSRQRLAIRASIIPIAAVFGLFQAFFEFQVIDDLIVYLVAAVIIAILAKKYP